MTSEVKKQISVAVKWLDRVVLLRLYKIAYWVLIIASCVATFNVFRFLNIKESQSKVIVTVDSGVLLSIWIWLWAIAMLCATFHFTGDQVARANKREIQRIEDYLDNAKAEYENVKAEHESVKANYDKLKTEYEKFRDERV